LSSWAFAYRCCPLLTGVCSSSGANRGPLPGAHDQRRLDTVDQNAGVSVLHHCDLPSGHLDASRGRGAPTLQWISSALVAAGGVLALVLVQVPRQQAGCGGLHGRGGRVGPDRACSRLRPLEEAARNAGASYPPSDNPRRSVPCIWVKSGAGRSPLLPEIPRGNSIGEATEKKRTEPDERSDQFPFDLPWPV
jgi:hypothetical protein